MSRPATMEMKQIEVLEHLQKAFGLVACAYVAKNSGDSLINEGEAITHALQCVYDELEAALDLMRDVARPEDGK